MKITEVTVVVCVKNRKDLIRQTLQSIESQDEVDVRLIVKDGKSTDGTVEEVANYLKNSTITDYLIVSEPDSSIADAFNQSLRYVGNGNVIFIHSDDTLVSRQSLKLLCQGIGNHRWGFGFYNFIDAENKLIRSERLKSAITFARMLVSNQVRHQCAIVKGTDLKSIKFNNLTHALDYDFFLNLWRSSPPKVVPAHIANFRIHDNLSADFDKSLKNEWLARVNFRIFQGNPLWLVSDSLVFLARYLKLRLRKF